MWRDGGRIEPWNDGAVRRQEAEREKLNSASDFRFARFMPRRYARFQFLIARSVCVDRDIMITLKESAQMVPFSSNHLENPASGLMVSLFVLSFAEID